MNREEAAKLLPIIKAFSEGKEIQKFIKNYTVGSDRWIDVNSIDTYDKREYRIKPEPKYRPFANVEECWAEMQKHQPFGWVKNKGSQALFVCKAIGCIIEIGIEDTPYTYKHQFDTYTFADGTPFGIKEEE